MNKAEQRQFAFDKALNGVRKQGGLSLTLAKACAYRSPSTGSACGIGHLIPDSLYHPDFEKGDSSVTALIKRLPKFTHALQAGGVDPDNVGAEFLGDLQVAHDSCAHFIERQNQNQQFERNMAELALIYGLVFKELA